MICLFLDLQLFNGPSKRLAKRSETEITDELKEKKILCPNLNPVKKKKKVLHVKASPTFHELNSNANKAIKLLVK